MTKPGESDETRAIVRSAVAGVMELLARLRSDLSAEFTLKLRGDAVEIELDNVLVP